MLEAKEITDLLAKTYFNAARSEGIDMVKVASVLEHLRPRFNGPPVYDIWKHIRLDESDLQNDNLLGVFVRLKFDYYDLVYRSAVRLIATEAEKNPDNAFQTWLDIYINALVSWESNVYDRVDDIEPKMARAHIDFMHSAQKYHDFVRENRWADCYDWYAGLARHERISAELRAGLEIIAGQIQLYHILDPEAARIHFEKAQALGLKSARLERAFGDLHLNKQEFDAARLRYLTALSYDDADADNYIALGDSYRDERKYKLAEDYYRQAIRHNPIDVSAYDRLIYLYGEPDIFSENVDKIPALLEKIELLNPKSKDERYANWRYGSYRSVGGAYYRNNDFSQAVIWYRKAIKSQPRWPLAYLDLGYALYADKKTAEAKKALLKAESISPDNFDVIWALAWFYDQEKISARASEYYNRCLEIRPQAGKTLHVVLGDIYANQMGDYDRAIEQYEKATVLNPGDATGFEKLAKAYTELNRSEQAESAWHRAAALDPAKSDYQNEIGIIYYRRGDYAKAAEYFQKALDLRPTDVVINDNLGQALQNAGRIDEAERVYLKSLEMTPENAPYHNRLGNFYTNIGQQEKALEQYRIAVEQDASNPVYHENMGFIYKAMNMPDEARRSYEKAAGLAPENGNYPNEIGILYFSQNDFEKAAEYFKKATDLNPDDGVMFDNLGQSLERTGRAEAEQAYLRATTLKPDRDDYLNRLGNFYANKGEDDKAVPWYEKAIAVNPGDSVYYSNLASSQRKLARYEEAEKTCLAGLAVSPDYHILLNLMGVLCLDRKAYDTALEYIRKAVAIDPGNQIYQINLAETYYMLGDYANASEHVMRAIELQPDNELYPTYLLKATETLSDKSAFVTRLRALAIANPRLQETIEALEG